MGDSGATGATAAMRARRGRRGDIDIFDRPGGGQRQRDEQAAADEREAELARAVV